MHAADCPGGSGCAWEHVLTQPRDIAQRVLPLPSSVGRASKLASSITRPTLKVHGWIWRSFARNHFSPSSHAASNYSNTIFSVAWRQPGKVLSSYPLTSIAPLPEFPSPPTAPHLWSQHSPSCPLHFHFCFFTSLLNCIATLIGKLKRKRYEEQQKKP